MKKSHSLYDTDFYKWITDQARFLKEQRFDKLDIENLVDEIESLGRQEERRLQGFFEDLLVQLLKNKYAPSLHTSSWDSRVKLARLEIAKSLKESPSLKPHLQEILVDAYTLARLKASGEIDVDDELFPQVCPWTADECMHGDIHQSLFPCSDNSLA